MKKYIGIILSLMLSFSIVSDQMGMLYAFDTTENGTVLLNEDNEQKCGENAFWTLDDGKLVIYGSGAMNDFSSWQGLENEVREIVIEEGITEIGNLSLSDFDSLSSLTIPSSVSKIESLDVNEGVVIFIDEGTYAETFVYKHGLNYRYIGDEKNTISLDRSKVSIYENRSLQLNATIKPSSAPDQRIQWNSSNEKVAIVDENGYVTSKGIGTTLITATVTNGKSAQCQVRVIRDIRNSQVVYRAEQAYTGKEIKPAVSVKYGNLELKKGTDYLVSYRNNKNAGIATIVIVGKGNYGGSLERKFKIQILPKSIKFNVTHKTLYRGKSFTLKPIIAPTNATNKKVSYTSSNSKVATVTNKGTVKALRSGMTTIIAKTTNGKSAKCTVIVPYTITYHLNGGKNHKSNPKTYYGKRIVLKNPTKKGYTFIGWYRSHTYKTKIKSFSSGNKNVFSKWNKVTVGKNKVSLSKYDSNKIEITYSSIKGVKGYQLQYANNDSFTNAKTRKTTSRHYVTPALAKGNNYYVRVRGYKIDSTGSVVYGKWSNTKSLQIPKPVVQPAPQPQPQPEPAPTPQPEPEPEPSTPVSTMVYVSRTGSKYHSNPNCSNMKNPSYVFIDEAIGRGLGPCSKCY